MVRTAYIQFNPFTPIDQDHGMTGSFFNLILKNNNFVDEILSTIPMNPLCINFCKVLSYSLELIKQNWICLCATIGGERTKLFLIT